MDWSKKPFTETITVADTADCPDGYEEMVYDIWLGLEDGCFCQEGSELESTARTGGCLGKQANSPYCRSRPPITAVVRKNFNGVKVCGKRDGSNFLTATRPRGGDGRPYSCPSGTEPCGGDAYLNDGTNHEHVLCVEDVATECPITGIAFGVDVDGDFEATTSKIPD